MLSTEAHLDSLNEDVAIDMGNRRNDYYLVNKKHAFWIFVGAMAFGVVVYGAKEWGWPAAPWHWDWNALGTVAAAGLAGYAMWEARSAPRR